MEGIAQWLERWESWGVSLFSLERREDGSVVLSRLFSLIAPANLRSIRVAERLGERYERDVDVRGRTSRLYSVAA